LPNGNFEEFITLLQTKLNSLVTEPIQIKKINYGQQLILQSHKEKVILAVYNGKKAVSWFGVAKKELCKKLRQQ